MRWPGNTCSATRTASPATDRVTRWQTSAGLPTGTPVNCLNVVELAKWLRNPPGVVPMDATQNAEGLYRGMPNLGLSETQIAQLIAYLATVK